MNVPIVIKEVRIPGFVRQLPRNIVEQLIGVQGGFRLQRSIGEGMRAKWRIKVPLFFHRRADLGLPTTGQFERALTYRVTEHNIRFVIKPCYGRDGFNYVHSLTKGRRGVQGKHYVPALDCLLPGGSTRGTTSQTYERLKDAMMFVLRKWIKEHSPAILDRAIAAARGKP